MKLLTLDEVADLEHIFMKSERVKMSLCFDPNKRFVCLMFSEDLEGSEPSNFAPKDGVQPKRSEFLTVEKVAAEIGWSPKTVRKLIRDRYLKALDGVRPYRITRESVDRYLQGTTRREDPDPSNHDIDSMPDDVKRPSGGKSQAVRPRATVLQSDMKNEKEARRADEDMKSWGR